MQHQLSFAKRQEGWHCSLIVINALGQRQTLLLSVICNLDQHEKQNQTISAGQRDGFDSDLVSLRLHWYCGFCPPVLMKALAKKSLRLMEILHPISLTYPLLEQLRVELNVLSILDRLLELQACFKHRHLGSASWDNTKLGFSNDLSCLLVKQCLHVTP